VALQSESTQASDLRAARGPTSQLSAPSTSDQGSYLGPVTTRLVHGGGRMVEIFLPGSGEGPGRVTAPGYSTAAFLNAW
jgi:hypothetical protein